MRQIFQLLCITAAFICSFSFTSNAHDDAKEVRYITQKQVFDEAYQTQLRSQAAWRAFVARHPKWSVHFNEGNQLPHRAFGNPIALNSSFNPVEAVKNFVSTELEAFRIPLNELELTGTHRSAKYTFVNFVQYYQGLEVINSRLTFKLSPNGELIMFGADVFNQIQLTTQAQITANTAAQQATADLSHIERVETANRLKVLAIPGARNYDFRLVYEVIAEGHDAHQKEMPTRYVCLVDAHSGELLSRHNTVVQIAPSGGQIQVKGTIFPTHLLQPSEIRALPHLRVVVDNVTNFTDAEGSIQIAGPYPKNAAVSLQGRWSRVVSGNSGNITPSFTASIDSLTDSLLFDNQGTAPDIASIRHITAYYHTSVVHDYMKSLLPAFTALDFPLLTRVDRTDGNCNAFFNGNSINFYTTAGGCNALSQVADVIYHEYGHAITNYFYDALGQNFQNGGMGEGYSDIFAITLTDNPVLGVGFTNNAAQVIRRYDQNPKIYPQNLVGQVHADGEIICGAWWRTANAIGSNRTQMEILAESMYGLANAPNGQEGQLYTDILIDAIQADDNDNDLTNGTPHMTQIINSFGFHGIRLLTNVNFNFNQLPDAPAQQAIPIQINVGIAPPLNNFLDGVDLVYTINDGPQQTLAMAQQQNDYSASIPAQAEGTIIRYYFALRDLSGVVSGSKPLFANASSDPALWYNMLVGYGEMTRDDAENPATHSQWQLSISTDNATSGRWQVGVPIPSYATPGDLTTITQPGTNATPGGSQCFFTQNATSPNSPIGTADVDGGRTTLITPSFDLSGYTEPVLSYQRWYTNDMGSNPNSDFWEVFISFNGTNWIRIERTTRSDRSWRRNVIKVRDYGQPTATVSLRFLAQDPVSSGSNQGGSIVEAAIDDIIAYDLNSALSVDDLLLAAHAIKIYPNPAKQQATIELPMQKAGKVGIRLLNTLGQAIEAQSWHQFDAGLQHHSLAVDHLAPGLYLVEVEAHEQRHYLRLLVD